MKKALLVLLSITLFGIAGCRAPKDGILPFWVGYSVSRAVVDKISSDNQKVPSSIEGRTCINTIEGEWGSRSFRKCVAGLKEASKLESLKNEVEELREEVRD